MSKDLHVFPNQPLGAGQKWNKATCCLTLNKAGKFTVASNVENYLDKLYPKPKPFVAVKEEVYNKMSAEDKTAYKKKYQKYNEESDAYDKNIAKERDKIKWCWQLAGKRIDPDKISHNNSFSLGISELNTKQIIFPKLLEGGGMSWLEIFTDKNRPAGVPPHGMFVRALGTPRIISAEWRDSTGKLITKEIAFGSTVYLHIYTEALYGQNIEIQLRDTKLVNGDLTPTPSDEDGDPIQQLAAKPLTRFTRPVNTHKYNKATMPPAGTITDAIITEKGKDQISSSNVQKCVFPIFIEPAWQFQGSGTFDSGSKLSINPIVHHAKIKDGQEDVDAVLKVSKEGILMKGELKGNNPLLVGEAEDGGIPEEQKKIDFTFGVFIDGTLNNMYNTIARQAWEDDQIERKYYRATKEEQQRYTENPNERLKVAATKQEQIGEKDESRYKYTADSSFENDLSNPAILYKNYIKSNKDKLHPVFKIYTEGMGTNTLATKINEDGSVSKEENFNEDGILPVENYKTDDMMEGTGFGQGNAGILDRVKRAIELMVDKIKESDEIDIGIITVDVFGFSRGAASARCFVNEITRQSYMAKATGNHIIVYKDANGYEVSEKYSDKKLPTNGRLGYLLTEAQITFEKLVIRFAGLYDTVPHHGFVQWNDVNDLGLNAVSKAKYTVHMVAADEHRANFDLVDISCITGKKGGGKTDRGIELYLPGVHCDVGGSYVEGRSEVNGRLLVSQSMYSNELEKEQERLITEGWFQNKEELYVHWDNAQRNVLNGVARVLSSNRKAISNQYSYIPLHLMVSFCVKKEVQINVDGIKKGYKFKTTKFTNSVFLEKIKTRLEDYAFHDGKPFVFQNVPMRTIVYSSDDFTAVEKEEQRRKTEEAELNADIKKLRHGYLHWNAAYGEGVVNTLVQANKPNFEDGKRKRKING